MAVRAEAVVLNVKDAGRASAFWTRALDYEPSEEQPDFLLPREGNGVRVHLDAGFVGHQNTRAAVRHPYGGGAGVVDAGLKPVAEVRDELLDVAFGRSVSRNAVVVMRP